MPVMDGISATEEIRRRVATVHQPHIIAITANVLNDERRRCLDCGMNDYVSKPINLPELQAALARAIARLKAKGEPGQALGEAS